MKFKVGDEIISPKAISKFVVTEATEGLYTLQACEPNRYNINNSPIKRTIEDIDAIFRKLTKLERALQ